MEMVSGYRILDHPADLGIEAWGEDLKEAFEQAAMALMSVILDLSTIDDKDKRMVAIEGTDEEHLLVKWLSEVLYLYDGEGFVGRRFEVSELTASSLKGTVHGETFDPSEHTTKLDVKAVTYHQIAIEEGEEGARLRVYLDV